MKRSPPMSNTAAEKTTAIRRAGIRRRKRAITNSLADLLITDLEITVPLMIKKDGRLGNHMRQCAQCPQKLFQGQPRIYH